MDRSPPPPSSRRGIPYLAGPPTYLSFQKEYLLPLQPLIFLDQRLPETWPAHHLLTKHASDAQVVPDVDAFAEIYNGSAVTVVQGAPDSGYGEDRREDIKVEEFARLWRQGEPKGELIYLKDFHLCLARPDLALYRVYDLFQDDWMNAHALHCTKDDYRFLYLGTSGTTTAFHHDVYLSHSWSTSVCGIKRWILLAPEHAYLLNHRRTGEPIADLFAEKVGAGGDSVLDYPGSGEARQRCLVVWQYPNETMFVPSGWYHSVKNYGPTLSINHNWANVSCLIGMYGALSEQVRQSVDLLSDLRPSDIAPVTSPSTRAPEAMPLSEFYDLIYNNLVRPNWGWSFCDFWAVVDWVLQNSQGGPRWDLDARTSVGASEMRMQVTDLALRWLQREESSCLGDLRATVERVLQRARCDSISQ